MSSHQHTIKQPVTLQGIGLHTGKTATLTFLPAACFHGIKFQRVDLPNQPVIPADCDLVTSVERGTTLELNGARVSTVEHLMAAIAGLQIDNLLIQINEAEIPILDGSARPFIDILEQAGLEEQKEEREVFELRSNLQYSDPDKQVEMMATPSDRYRVTSLIDFKSPVLGQQHASLDRLSDFKEQFSSARTFCFLHELEMLLEAGLIKGGDLDNAIVVVDKPIGGVEKEKLQKLFNRQDIDVVEEGILNNIKLRHANEPARHKLLDVVGDLALIGTPINANIIASKPGHKSNIEFARLIKQHIRKAKLAEESPIYDPNTEPIYTATDIEKMLPHRYPFLLVDKIIQLSAKEVVGVKSVTYNEPFFTGHFPGNPIMPGVLILEAMAQCGGVLVLYDKTEPHDTYFLKIDKAKFKSMVRPGDSLIIQMTLTQPIRRGLVEMAGKAYVGNKLVCEAEMMAKIQKR